MNLFGLPPGAPFAEAFAAGFWDRFEALAPEEVARILLLVNNQRASRVLTDALAAFGGKARLLPRIRVIGELGTDPALAPDLPLSIDPMRRELRLTCLVEAFLRREGADRMAPLSAAPDLARSLASLLDECDEAGIDPSSLDQATNGEHAEHWARSLSFFEVIRTYWPQIAAEEEAGALGPKARQRAVIEDLVAEWAERPPDHPVVIAGSTGSVRTTGLLMARVAQMPRGLVVLPGLDRHLPKDIWEVVADGAQPEHPQAPFVGLLAALEATPDKIRPWAPDVHRPARQSLLRQEMRPAPVTDAWYGQASVLNDDLTDAVADLTLLEAPSPRHEAGAIAAAVRAALEAPEKTVLILSQDAALARRIVAELDRYAIEPDDSLGRPLAQSPPAVFLRLIAEVAEGPAGPVEIAALLAHPLLAQGGDRVGHLTHAKAYERAVLRRRGVDSGVGLAAWPEAEGEAAAWFDQLEAALGPLVAALKSGAALVDIAHRHVAAAEALHGAQDGQQSVWATESGKVVEHLMQRLIAASDAFGEAPVVDYGRLLAGLMRNEELRQPGPKPHPRVTLMSPRESRVASADLVILAGLNEGNWPHLPGADPWLSRPMRIALGLPSPERVVGLAAHDFLQAAMGPEVILSRATKAEGAPTVPSRWLTRLEILVDGLDRARGEEPSTVEAMRDRGRALLEHLIWAHRPDEALRSALPRATRPEPRPPVDSRPKRLSVTMIERLVRDPYAVYARRILGLNPLDPLGNAPGYRDRGEVIHKVLERFTHQTMDRLPEDAEAHFMAVADDLLRAEIALPALRRTWRARILRFCPWFLNWERARRAAGRPIGVEISGRMTLPGLSEYEITAKADRIDRLNSGSAAIYDYKAGDPPSEKQVAKGFNQQLHLQAAILAQGGFDGLSALEAVDGRYIGLTGSGEGGKERSIGIVGEVESHLAQVAELLTAYRAEAMPYLPRIGFEKRDDESDYDHLSRFGEWEGSDGG
ncbi:MAG: double-strand break repair protein AddB [Pseudomonadota bacterium]